MSISSLQGYVETTPIDELDSDRYEFITLSQTEPNLGAPESDGAILISNVDGTRSFTTSPTLSGLNFKASTLDEVISDPSYFLVLKGDPTDGIADSIGWSLGTFEETDTLFTVTQPTRGVGHDSTDQRLTMLGLVTLDSASIGANLSVGGDLFLTGDLFVEGDNTVLNTQNVTIEDKSLLLGKGSLNSIIADSSGILIDGTQGVTGYASMLYRSATDTFNFSRGIVAVDRSQFDSVNAQDVDATRVFIDSDLKFDGANYPSRITKADNLLLINADTIGFNNEDSSQAFVYLSPEQITLQNKLVAQDSAIFQNELYFENVPEKDPTGVRILFRRSTDGQVQEGEVESEAIAGEIKTQPTNEDSAYYFVITQANNGAGGFDSGEHDLDLTYNPSSNTLDVVNIDVSGLTQLDSTIVQGDLKLGTSLSSQTPSGRLLDSEGRSFVIYDSAGNLLWGNNGVSAGNLGGPAAAQLFLQDLGDVQLASVQGGEVLKYDATLSKWVNGTDQTGGGGGGGGIALTDLSVVDPDPTPAGNGDLVYNNVTGEFTYTPPDLSSFLTGLSGSSLNDLSNVNTSPTDGQVLKYDLSAGEWIAADDLAGGGSGTFISLSDTPVSYGTAGQVVRINSTNDGLEFATLSGGGGITDIASATDTDIVNVQTGQVLKWNGLDWANFDDTFSFAALNENPDAATYPAGHVDFDEVAMNATTVLVVTNNGSSAYRFDQYGTTDNPTIYAKAGTTIGFNVNALGIAHPFEILDGGGSQYNEGLEAYEDGIHYSGVNAQGQFGGTLYWRIPAGISGNYQYRCQNHGSMNGTIVVEAAAGGGGSGLTSRTTKNGTSTLTLTSNTDGDLDISSMFYGYALLKIETNYPAWVRLYTDTTARTDDASRLITDDPALDAGVIAEAITSTGNLSVRFTPATIGWLDGDGYSNQTLYCKVRNLDTLARDITVTLTLIELEV